MQVIQRLFLRIRHLADISHLPRKLPRGWHSLLLDNFLPLYEAPLVASTTPSFMESRVTQQEHPLFETQVRLEKEMRERGIRRFNHLHEAAAKRGEWADTSSGQGVVAALMPKFVEAVQEFVDSKPGTGRRNAAIRPLKDFGDVPAACFLFVKNLMNLMMTLHPNTESLSGETLGVDIHLSSLLTKTSAAIHDEHRMRYFAENHKTLLKYLWEDFNKRDLSRRRRKDLVQKTFQKLKMDWKADGWTRSVMVHMGHKLADIFVESTGIASVETKRIGGAKNRSSVFLCIRPEFVQVLLNRHEALIDTTPTYFPTVVPPRPWTNGRLFGGGYWTHDTTPYPFLKKAKRAYLEELENTDLSNVLAATNAVQETGRRINPVILETLSHLADRGGVADLPDPDPIPYPDYPKNYEEMPEEEQFEFRKRRYLIREKNRKEVSRRLSLLTTLSLAERFSEYPAIYFPHNLDSRGRCYPLPQCLNPQGPDYAKALLEFSEGKAIKTETAATWLFIATANAWGFDKADLEARADWVVDNQEMILAVSENPLDDLRWTQAEEPFQFLRLALDVRGYAEAQAAGTEFVSHAVIPVDATCSGIQHFSAMLRDEVGGAATNLTPTDTRQDIYQIVADLTTERLHQIVERDDPFFTDDQSVAMAGAAIDFGITRKTTKRSVMVVPYSGTMHSCMEYVGKFYKKEIEEGAEPPWDPMGKFRGLVAKVVWDAIGDTVVSAKAAMKWLSDSTRLVCKEEHPLPIMWVTPAGLPVQQWVMSEEHKRLAVTWFDGKVSKLSLAQSTGKPDARRMASSVAPNFVHSMDAAHLQLTVTRSLNAHEEGTLKNPISWSVVHDSFGCHASDMDNLFQFLREAFVYMYEEHDVLAEFEEHLAPLLSDPSKIPERPVKGALDMAGVLESQFFFS